MQTLYGKPAANGVARGRLKAIRHNRRRRTDGAALSWEEEILRYRAAVKKAEAELTDLTARAAKTVGESEAAIFEIHRLMLLDEDFRERVESLIREAFAGAEKAVETAGEELAKAFGEMDTEYMRARAADVRSVTERLTDILRGDERISWTLEEPCVLASDDLSPAETLCLDKTKVLGIITEFGSGSSHTAILARSMGIPAVAGVQALPPDLDGRDCIVDGDRGEVYVDPDRTTIERFQQTEARRMEIRREEEVMRGARLTNADGKRIQICANAAEPDDVAFALANDAEGIGLFRSEFLFMRYERSPTEEEQFAVYRRIVEEMRGAPCVIRTLDAGADKNVSYLNLEKEKNPALGVRAIRLCLKRPELLEAQFRALYRAAAYGALSAMIPMATLPSEMEQVRVLAERAARSLERDGVPIGDLKIGMMIETPASALCAEQFAGLADFFSIGTNDLIQYTLAADRENREVARLSDPLPESVKRLIRMTCAAAAKIGVPVGVCGELGSDERYVGFLLDCGVTRLSVNPPDILSVRRIAAEHLTGGGISTGEDGRA